MSEDAPYTVEQFTALNAEQHAAILAVAEYLSSTPVSEDILDSESTLNEIFNLLKPSHGCVPSEEADGEILTTIRNKFGAVYAVAMHLAEAEIPNRGIKGLNLCYITEPSYEDATHVTIIDFDGPYCYLHEWAKAWHFHFQTLQDLANDVLRAKNQLLEKIIQLNQAAPAPPNKQSSTTMDSQTEKEINGCPCGHCGELIEAGQEISTFCGSMHEDCAHEHAQTCGACKGHF